MILSQPAYLIILLSNIHGSVKTIVCCIPLIYTKHLSCDLLYEILPVEYNDISSTRNKMFYVKDPSRGSCCVYARWGSWLLDCYVTGCSVNVTQKTAISLQKTWVSLDITTSLIIPHNPAAITPRQSKKREKGQGGNARAGVTFSCSNCLAY